MLAAGNTMTVGGIVYTWTVDADGSRWVADTAPVDADSGDWFYVSELTVPSNVSAQKKDIEEK